MIATVWSDPSRPAATLPAVPYAPRSIVGVYPFGAHGYVSPRTVPRLSAQKVENGPALRKPNEGGAFVDALSGRTSAADSSRPTTDSTTPASDDGIVRALDGARSVIPL